MVPLYPPIPTQKKKGAEIREEERGESKDGRKESDPRREEEEFKGRRDRYMRKHIIPSFKKKQFLIEIQILIEKLGSECSI